MRLGIVTSLALCAALAACGGDDDAKGVLQKDDLPSVEKVSTISNIPWVSACSAIKESEASKQQQINEAQGQAEAILSVATATAEGLRRVGEALAGRGGMEAMQLRVAEEYVKQFGKLADEANSTLVIPATLSDVASMIALATNVIRKPAN